MKADWILFAIIGFQMCTLDFLYFQNFMISMIFSEKQG